MRIYKALYGDRANLLEEERKILNLIEDISYEKEICVSEGLVEEGLGFADVVGEDLEDDGVEIGESVDGNIGDLNIQPKHINIKKDIDVVRVIQYFPAFTDGNYCYILKKNDVIALNKEIATILEKHNIVKKVNIHENEKEDKKVLPIL